MEAATRSTTSDTERARGTLSAIATLRYPSSACVRYCRCDELPCPLLTWLVSELWATCPELRDGKSDIVLVGELRRLLATMHCPLMMLASDALDSTLLNQVVEFLVSELQAARMLQYRELHPDDTADRGETSTERGQRAGDPCDDEAERRQQVEDDEVSDASTRREETLAEFALLLRALDMEAVSQFSDVLNEVEARLATLPASGEAMMEPLLNTSLSSKQWRDVEKINNILLEDYQCRQQMIIKRFEVTLKAFAWGDKEEVCNKALATVAPLSSLALSSSQVSLSLLLAARKDQSCIRPLRAGPSTAVYKVLMGSVPDRGGRPGEIEPPMPSWTGRREKGPGRGGASHQPRRKFSEKKKKGKSE